MEADFLVAAGKPSPHGLGFVLRGRMAVAARLAVLCLALGLAGCQAVDNPANAAPTLSTGTTAKTSADPIVLAGAPPTTVTVGDPYYYAPTVSQGGGPISFSIQGQPAWLSFDTQTGALAGTPAAADVGVSGGIIITATNSVDTVSIVPSASRSTLSRAQRLPHACSPHACSPHAWPGHRVCDARLVTPHRKRRWVAAEESGRLPCALRYERHLAHPDHRCRGCERDHLCRQRSYFGHVLFCRERL